MIFHNKAGQSMSLADNLTIKELAEMGVELTLSEKIDPDHELWLADDFVKKPEVRQAPQNATHH